MIKKMSRILANMKIRYKLSLLVVGTTLLILLVNVFMYYNLNRITKQMDEIYVSNVTLSELEDSLDTVQSSMAQYLNTKSTDSLNDYYLAEQQFESMLSEMDHSITDNQQKLMERNIYYMSEKYLEMVSDTIDAKRGRNVEKYKDTFEQSGKLYSYIKSYIDSLNGYSFRSNTESYSAMSTSVEYLEMISVLMFAVLAAFNIMLVILVTKNITKPLHELSIAANKVSAGELENTPEVKVHGKDEVGVVTVAFNQMVSSIPGYLTRLRDSMEKEQQLKEKEILMEAHLKDAQLKYLQAQINPHFLFNTLNTGAQLAMMENADKTCYFLEQVADFFRYNIQQEKKTATIDEELGLVDNFVYIMKVRFGNRLDFEKEIPVQTFKEEIPVMTLQPLVENCIKHGLKNKKVKVILSIQTEEKYIVISISDNGSGIPDQIKENVFLAVENETTKLPEQILNQNNVLEDQRQHTGTGLINVFLRLKLYFHRNDIFDITSGENGEGTKFIIRIPKHV